MNILDYIDSVDSDWLSHQRPNFQTRSTPSLLKFKRLNHAESHRIINIFNFQYKLYIFFYFVHKYQAIHCFHRFLYCYMPKDIKDICFLSVKDRNSFHRVDTIGNIFTSGAAMSENITDVVHEMK